MTQNLNEIDITTDGHPQPQDNHSTTSGNIRVVFKDLAQDLVRLIHRPEVEVVVGCVAWLTHPKILEAISRQPASIIVQKEDFLRPDGDSNKTELRAAYKKISGLDRMDCGPLLRSMSICSDPTLDGVRCVGVGGQGRNRPRMHHKFLVFGRWFHPEPECASDLDAPGLSTVEPFAVWTGSFNFTYNATQSFENAIYIEDAKIAQAYFDEFQQVAALSETLDWDSEYVEPEWRIGT